MLIEVAVTCFQFFISKQTTEILMVYIYISRDDLRQHLMNVKKQVAQQQAQESESSSSSSSDDSSSSSSDSSNSSSDSSSGSKSCIVHITSQINISWNKH